MNTLKESSALENPNSTEEISKHFMEASKQNFELQSKNQLK